MITPTDTDAIILFRLAIDGPSTPSGIADAADINVGSVRTRSPICVERGWLRRKHRGVYEIDDEDGLDALARYLDTDIDALIAGRALSHGYQMFAIRGVLVMRLSDGSISTFDVDDRVRDDIQLKLHTRRTWSDTGELDDELARLHPDQG